MTPMRAVFRFDTSPSIGAGHAYRCVTLAEALSRLGWSCNCLVNAEAVDTVPALKSHPHLAVSEAADHPHEEVDWLIVDHYGLDAAWEEECRNWVASILVVDDLADRQHDCDVLLDQTFGRNPGDYGRLVPTGCRILVGSDYALLRPAFAQARPASLARRRAGSGLQRLLVSLGATDPENYTSDVLRGIAQSGLSIAVDVALGAGAPHLEAVRAQVSLMPQDTELHVDTREMAALMARADLAIGAAGTSTWERCCLGLPSLLVVTAENQRRIAETVTAAGAARLVTAPRADLSQAIGSGLCAAAAEPAALADMSAKSAAICDGRGCDRVSLALVPPGRSKDGRSVSLRLAGPADEASMLEWQSHPSTRRYARNPAVPSAEEHRRWFAERLTDPDSLLTVITLDGTPAGVLRLDPAASATARRPAYEVSILVDPRCRSLGIALEALRFLRRWQAAAIIAAKVLPGNIASAELFRSAGYVPELDGLLYSRPSEATLTATS